MNMPVNFFTEKLENIDMHEVLNRSIETNADIISDQVTNQLKQGVDGNNESLGRYANYAYKNRFKPVDLRLTGAFWNSIAPKTYQDYFEMTATDEKTEMLTQKYGDAIIDMSKESIVTASEYIKEGMIEIFETEISK